MGAIIVIGLTILFLIFFPNFSEGGKREASDSTIGKKFMAGISIVVTLGFVILGLLLIALMISGF